MNDSSVTGLLLHCVRCTPEPPTERRTTNELILALALIALCLYAIREMFRSLR
jgi:hypothetical protein